MIRISELSILACISELRFVILELRPTSLNSACLPVFPNSDFYVGILIRISNSDLHLVISAGNSEYIFELRLVYSILTCIYLEVLTCNSELWLVFRVSQFRFLSQNPNVYLGIPIDILKLSLVPRNCDLDLRIPIYISIFLFVSPNWEFRLVFQNSDL